MIKNWFATAVLAGTVGVSGAALAEKPIELTFSTYLPPAYEYISKPIDNFVETVQKESNGRVKINVFHSGQLFDGYEELAALSRGDVDMVNMTGTYPGGTVAALNIFTMPFAFQDIQHLQRALAAGLLDLGIRQELLNDHDTVILGVAPLDPYELYSRTTPVLTVDDFKGKVWASTGATDARAIQLLGGSPTSMSSGDLYLSFDRGVIDGTPRPLITGMGRSLYEVVKHISLANLAIDTSILSINKKKWDALPKDVQDIMIKAAQQRDAEQFERVNAYVQDVLAQFKEKGMTIHRVDEQNLEAMRQATAPAVSEWVAQVKDGDQYLKVIEATKQ